jgi:hypothetical protein
MTDLWLEKELTRQLAPVTAPESLWDRIGEWDRINEGRAGQRRRVSLERIFWPVAAAMVLLALAGVLRTLGTDRDPDKLAEQELATMAGVSRGFDFRSESFEDTRAWVKAAANIDIDLPPGQPAADRGIVRLLGARLIHVRGLPIAAIDYRVGDEVATLFVSGKRAGLTGNTEASRHLFSKTGSPRKTRLFSWNMRNQTYTIAFSGAEIHQGACLLCHANTPGLMVFGLP